MALGQFEFALLASVSAAFLIFTPQPLVLLRNLLIWAALTWLAWHGHECWHTSPWLRQLVDGLYAGQGFSAALEVTQQHLLEALDSWKAESSTDIRRNRAWARIWAASLFVQVLQWLQDDSTTSDRLLRGDRNPSRPLKYQVIVVTKPSGQVYGPVSDHLCARPDRPEPIPWASTTTDGIPSMLTLLAFRRDFALCLIPTKVWNSTKKTLAEKFEGHKFWDYYGDMGGSRAVTWTRGCIDQINAIHDVGVTACEEDAVTLCTKHYDQLRRDWNYLSIWWSDADFAIILASLLTDDMGMSVCRTLMSRRDELRRTEVIEPRQQTLHQGSSIATVATIGAGVLIPMTGGLAAPLLAPVVAGSLLGRVASEVAGSALKFGEMRRLKQREEARDALQQKFPQLNKIFE